MIHNHYQTLINNISKFASIVTANNIISIAIIIKIIFFRFNMKPNIPIINKNRDKFIKKNLKIEPNNNLILRDTYNIMII